MIEVNLRKMAFFGLWLMFISTIIAVVINVIMGNNDIELLPFNFIMLVLIGAGTGIATYAVMIKAKTDIKKLKNDLIQK